MKISEMIEQCITAEGVMELQRRETRAEAQMITFKCENTLCAGRHWAINIEKGLAPKRCACGSRIVCG